jgi:hypothetical protein
MLVKNSIVNMTILLGILLAKTDFVRENVSKREKIIDIGLILE